MAPCQSTNLMNETSLPNPFLTGYFVCGHPTRKQSLELIVAAVNAGMDAVEIGIPSPNPYLDGEVIKQAHSQVLNDFHRDEDYLSFLIDLKEKITVPIWVMGYYQDLMKDDLYLTLAKSKLINGFVIPDLVINDAPALKQRLIHLNVELIPVINHGMSDKELRLHIKNTNLLYCQLYKGKTGKAIQEFSKLPEFYQRVRSLTNAPLMGGFGIKNTQLAKQVYLSGYDGVVVGSKLVSLIKEGDKEDLVLFIQELASAKTREVE